LKSLFSILLALAIYGCRVKGPLTAQESANVNINSEQVTDEKIQSLIAPYSERMSKSMNEVIGFCPAFIEKKKPSSAIGSMMADAVMETAREIYPKSTICLLNYGGIRSTLDSGDITVGEAFQLMPFENEIVVLKLHITYLDTLREFVRLKGGEPLSDNISDVGYIVANEDQYFYLATNDYIANGGDNYNFLLKAEDRVTTGIKIRDALISYIKKHNPLPLDYKNRRL